ncbi:MAG: class I SAM-dependent methyltransferase [Candidatus Andersenbacteria bacterium]|nr:class I SAM-dependent methyltransferase [Candidatus Andersenbacteria bacterium]MBI3250253.1 class I SAM-dependent methyltransferase [Candidatus Andersenbacteria bacterium]
MFPDPRPTDQDIFVYYPPNYNPFNPRQVTGGLARVKAFFDRRKALKVLRYVGPKEKIVDVGCSWGGFLAMLKTLGDWELSGIDTDPGSIEYARNVLKLNVRVESFEAFPEDTLYDCVIMKYTLDHLPSPAKAFEKLARIIRPGGYFVLQIPNNDSWEAAILKRYWHGWEIPRHMIYLTPQTTAAYAKKYGFTVKEVEHELNPNNWIWGLRYWALDHARFLVPFCDIKNPFLLAVLTPIAALAKFFKKSGRTEYILQRNK